MRDAPFVTIVDASKDLEKVFAGRCFIQTLLLYFALGYYLTFDQVEEITSSDELKYKIDLRVACQNLLQLDNVLVVDHLHHRNVT